MNIETKELVEAVDFLNDRLPEASDYYFTLEHTTYWSRITFNEIELWNSENDEREFNEDLNNWEPIIPFLKTTLSNKLEELTYIKDYL